MGMRTRRGFLGVLTASAFTAALGGTVALSAGCGGGTPQNTDFFGSYSGVWRVYVPNTVAAPNCTGTTPYDGQLLFSVDRKGRIRGSVYNPYGGVITSLNPSNSAGNLTGTVDNSGKFSANVDYGNGQSFDIKGSLSVQPNSAEQDPLFSAAVPGACSALTTAAATRQTTASPSPSPSPSPSASPTTTQKTGLVGNFRESIGGTDYNGYFFSEGGTTSSTTGG